MSAWQTTLKGTKVTKGATTTATLADRVGSRSESGTGSVSVSGSALAIDPRCSPCVFLVYYFRFPAVIYAKWRAREHTLPNPILLLLQLAALQRSSHLWCARKDFGNSSNRNSSSNGSSGSTFIIWLLPFEPRRHFWPLWGHTAKGVATWPVAAFALLAILLSLTLLLPRTLCVSVSVSICQVTQSALWQLFAVLFWLLYA